MQIIHSLKNYFSGFIENRNWQNPCKAIHSKALRRFIFIIASVSIIKLAVTLYGRLSKRSKPTPQDENVASVRDAQLGNGINEPSQRSSLIAAKVSAEMSPPPAPVGKKSPLIAGNESIFMPDLTGKSKKGDPQLLPGQHEIKILHGDNLNKLLPLIIQEPIYKFADAQFGNMTAPGACLIMDTDDFKIIKDLIHPGAFGNDYYEFIKGLMAVWKFPADLKEITGWKAPDAALDDLSQ